jgi:hypothetical protein
MEASGHLLGLRSFQDKHHGVMSETSQGPGWWLASDGRWYATELHPHFMSPTPPLTGVLSVTQMPPPLPVAPAHMGVHRRLSLRRRSRAGSAAVGRSPGSRPATEKNATRTRDLVIGAVLVIGIIVLLIVGTLAH